MNYSVFLYYNSLSYFSCGNLTAGTVCDVIVSVALPAFQLVVVRSRDDLWAGCDDV
jgi:hypothetical protein